MGIIDVFCQKSRNFIYFLHLFKIFKPACTEMVIIIYAKSHNISLIALVVLMKQFS